MCDPDGRATVLGVVDSGAPPPPPRLTQIWGVAGLGGRPLDSPGGGGSVGTSTYIPQNYPHHTLIILNVHKCDKKF